jgi:hypothetical protein
MDVDVDLLDTRNRVLRLALAITMGLICGVVLFRLVQTVAVAPNSDPMSKLSGIELAGGLVLASTAVIHAILTRVARRRRAG